MDTSKSLQRQVYKWWSYERILIVVLFVSLLVTTFSLIRSQAAIHHEETRSSHSEGFLRTTAKPGMKLQCTVVTSEDSSEPIMLVPAEPRRSIAIAPPPPLQAPVIEPILPQPLAPFNSPPIIPPPPPPPPKSSIDKPKGACIRDASLSSKNVFVNPNSPVPPPYLPPTISQGVFSRVIEPIARTCACSTWAYDRIHNKENSILSGDNSQPFQGGVKDINEFLPRIRKELTGASHITELGVREAISSWTFAAVAAEAADAGRPIAYRALDITKKDGVADLEAAMAQCPGVDFTFTEGSDLIVSPWRTDVMLLDTWHTYKQLAKELPIWTPYITKTLILHDTSLFGNRDEDLNGHGGKPVDESLFSGVLPRVGLWPAVEDFLNSAEGRNWRLVERIVDNFGLTILSRVSGEALA